MPSVNQSVNPLNGSFLGCALKSVPIIFQYFLLSFYKVDSSNLALNVNEELFLFLLETSGRKGKKKTIPSTHFSCSMPVRSPRL